MRHESRGMKRQWHRLALFVAVVLLGVPPVASAQQQASIIGRVVDDSGGVLPGVTVTVASPALQLQSVTAVTDGQGEYRVTTLPIGVYAVTYTLSGFQTVAREDVRLTAGFTARLDVSLKVGAVEEAITVSGVSPVIDATSTTTRTQLTRETLELTPTNRNSISGLMAQTPGARPALDVGGETMQSPPAFHAFGQDGESSQSIEGVVTNNPKSTNQGGNYWDYSSFDEAVVGTMAHDAEVPTRGVYVNAIIKSGGNDFHGSLFSSGTGRKFVNENVDEKLTAAGISGGNRTNARWDVSGDVGGRLIRDKLWFYASARTRGDHTESIGGFQPDGSPAVETGGNKFHTEKLTYQISQANRLTFFDTWAEKLRTDSGTSSLVAWESRIDQTLAHHTGKAEWQFVKGGSFVSSAQFGYWTGGSQQPWSGHTTDPATTDLVTLQVTGASTSAGQQTTDHQIGPKWTMSYYRSNWLGNHDFKAGLEYLDRASDRPWVIGEGGNYQRILQAGVPFEIITWNYPITPENPIHYFATYIQDSWTLGRRLTLNLGVRYAHDNGFVPEQCRDEAAPAPANVVAPASCFPARQFNIWTPVVPRLHAAYDVAGDGTTVIKGGWGVYGHLRSVDELTLANPNVATSTTYLWHDLNGNGDYDGGEINLDVNGPDFIKTSAQGNATLANGIPNPNEKEPTTDEFTVSVERQLVPGWALRTSGIYSRTHNTYRLQNSLRPPDTYSVAVTNPDPGPDGKVGTTDDPGTTLTYYEYPAALAGADFQLPWLVNDAKANQSYASFELAISKRLANRWQFMASHSATKKHIPILPVGSANGLAISVATDDPNAEIHNSDDTWEWLTRAEGAYLFPFDALVSFHYELRSGDPQARTVLLRGGKTIPSITLKAEPMGSLQLPNISLLDLRFEKTLRLTPTQKVAARVNIYNAMNINTVTSRTVQSGANYLRPTGIVTGRTFEFGATYSF